MTESRTTHRPLVLAAMVLAAFMGAIEGTIVATAMPSIAAEIGGFSLYSWVFSSFLLMQAVSIPIFGKVSDLLGRKPAFVAGVAVFLAGSILCGFAPSMEMLVAFRFVQGIGAGAVQPIINTLAGDLYSLEERGKVQGYLSSVWGVSSILGPLAGGVIVHQFGWPWIFWMNVPFGVIAVALIVLYLHEDVGSEERNIDYPGAFWLLLAVGPLMLALTQGSVWGAGAAAGLLAASIAAFVLFVRRERRAPDPMMHLEFWANPLIRNANVATLTAGVMMIGVITFLPTFVQGVLGGSALQAGFALSAMTLGWPIAAFVAGKLIASRGVQGMVRVGGLTLVAGSLGVALLAARGAVGAGAGSFLIGVGLGLMGTTTVVAIQTSVPWNQRGVATASNMLMRILGNALGAALYGGVLNYRMSGYLARQGLAGTVSIDSIQDLLGGAGRLSASVLAAVREGLSESLHLVFWGIVVMAVLTLAAAWRIPELEKEERPGS
ncbi:MAG TPA: MDR family MFS transporter [Longimicrobiaceae bacterium]|nr:MDR family MFS transporter [Longimicrobiaceae bacterium]